MAAMLDSSNRWLSIGIPQLMHRPDDEPGCVKQRS
jgi:hypothetical protein